MLELLAMGRDDHQPRDGQRATTAIPTTSAFGTGRRVLTGPGSRLAAGAGRARSGRNAGSLPSRNLPGWRGTTDSWQAGHVVVLGDIKLSSHDAVWRGGLIKNRLPYGILILMKEGVQRQILIRLAPRPRGAAPYARWTKGGRPVIL